MTHNVLTYSEIVAATTLYSACIQNAIRLLKDARLLIKNKRYPGAFFIAVTAKEELCKGQIVADYSNGFTPKDEMIKAFTNHRYKLSHIGVRYAVIAGKVGCYKFQENPKKVDSLFALRNDAIYVSFGENMKPIMPTDKISRKMAIEIVRAVSNEIADIQTMACMTERIGSASFLK